MATISNFTLEIDFPRKYGVSDRFNPPMESLKVEGMRRVTRVRSVKEYLESLTGVPQSEQLLSVNEEFLFDDFRKLWNFHILDGSKNLTLSLVLPEIRSVWYFVQMGEEVSILIFYWLIDWLLLFLIIYTFFIKKKKKVQILIKSSNGEEVVEKQIIGSAQLAMLVEELNTPIIKWKKKKTL